MFCLKCGAKIPDGSKFCPYCGFDGKQADSAPAQTPPPSPEKKPAKKAGEPQMTILSSEPRKEPNDSKWWIWLIIFVVCAAILTGIFIYGTKYVDYGDPDGDRAVAASGGVIINEGLVSLSTTPPASFLEYIDMINTVVYPTA